MFTFDNHLITSVELVKFACVFWIVWYTPFIVFRLFKGGYYNIWALTAYALSVSTMIVLIEKII